MPRSIFSDDTNVWFMRETSEGQFLYQIDCKDGAYACLGKLPEAPDGCYSPGTPVLGFQRVLMRYQGIESTMEFYALDDKLTLGEHLLSYGADDSYAIYFLHLFEIQETPQSFYFCGKSEENGLYLVSEIRKSGDRLFAGRGPAAAGVPGGRLAGVLCRCPSAGREQHRAHRDHLPDRRRRAAVPVYGMQLRTEHTRWIFAAG